MATEELMSRKRNIRLGDLQLRIMQVLWAANGPKSVADVQALVDGEPLAYTTVATMLRTEAVILGMWIYSISPNPLRSLCSG